MSIAHTSGKLIAYGLLIASLALPSFVSAEEQAKSSEELAPGFNICVKSATDTAQNSAEYRVALSVCLNLAEKYWEGIIQKKNQEYIKSYEDISDSQRRQQAVINFQKAWLQYKEIGSTLIRAEGDPMATIRARYFEVHETRIHAKFLTNDLTTDEDFPAVFNICIQKAEDTTDGYGPDYRHQRSDCLELAHNYLDPILEQNYEMYMNLHKESPEKQKNMQNFQKAWKQYTEAGCSLIDADGGKIALVLGSNFELNEKGRHARILHGLGLRW